MNDVAMALKKAGVKVPTINERIWNYLKENGEHTRSQIHRGLNINKAVSNSAISVMVRRKMLKCNHHVNTVRGVREQNTYEALGRIYALLPVSKSGAAGRAVANAGKVAAVVVPQEPQFSAASLVDKLTVHQAKEVYLYLHAVFTIPRNCEAI